MATATIGTEQRQMFIEGKWCDADSGKTYAVINPATEETLAEVAWGGRAETKRAIEVAHKAMKSWMKTTVYERAGLLKRTAQLMRDRADDLARTLTLEQGKPLGESKGEMLHSADTFEWFAEECKRMYGEVIPNWKPGKRHMTFKHPVGVVAAISPWNFPITLQSRKIAPALAAGCAIVCKPSEQTPLSLMLLFELMVEAGLPDGVANLVMGPPEEIGTEFMENPLIRKISFTGSVDVGKLLMRGGADQVKRLSLELGGHAPFIVFPDVDPELGAQLAVTGKFRNNGQVCIAPTRFYIHNDIRKNFIDAAVAMAEKLHLGNGMDEGVEIGPMFEQKAMDKALDGRRRQV